MAIPSTPRAAPTGLEARALALTWTLAALARRGGLEALASEPGSEALDPRDRAFAHALAAATLRRLGSLDRVLDARLQRPPPAPVRALLRLGLAQMAVLETPAFAAVSTTLALAERADDTRPFRGLINAVLRGIDRDGAVAALAAIDPAADAPDWLLARWRATWGEERARAIVGAGRREPPTDLTPRLATDSARLAALFDGEALPTGGVCTARRGDPAEWPEYAEGSWWVQDAAASLPARVVAPLPGERVLDMCAAPGGKTLQLAAAGARVVAVDRAAPRMARVERNLARTGLDAERVVADVERWEDPRRFDAVLLDAPCSATGVFRRRPDVLWAARAADIASLAGVQRRLLASAARRTGPGGRLVYCVCSLEPEEGEAQARAFLETHPEFRAGALDPPALGLPLEASSELGLRILPSFWEQRGHLDGFFVARFDRAPD